VRVDDLQNTNPFAKAGLMLRASLDPDAAMVILDVKPNSEIEFMFRPSAGADVVHVGGRFVTFPVWFHLSWVSTGGATTQVCAGVLEDKVDFIPPGNFSPSCVGVTLSAAGSYAGIAVTSHDINQLNTAHFAGLSLLAPGTVNHDIGNTGFTGNAAWE